MNTNPGQKLQMRATNFALNRLTSFAAYNSTQTQKRALSFLRPQMNQSAAATEDPMPTKTSTFFKIDPEKKPADLMH